MWPSIRVSPWALRALSTTNRAICSMCLATRSSKTMSPSIPMPLSWVASPLVMTLSSVVTSGSRTASPHTPASSSRRPSMLVFKTAPEYNPITGPGPSDRFLFYFVFRWNFTTMVSALSIRMEHRSLSCIRTIR